MDAGKSFSFPFEDQDWVSKLGLGALISMIPILNFAWSGYLVEIMRRVMNNDGNSLPTWDDLDKKFKDGLILFGAILVYLAPALIALCLPLGITALSGSLSSGNGNIQDLGRRLTESGGLLFIAMLCVFMLYGFLLSILYPAILIIFSREGTFASCFKLREAFDMISKNAAPFFTAWALSLATNLGVGLIAGFVNVVVGWIPCIGWVVGLILAMGAGAYSTTVYAHLFGQFGRVVFAGDQLAPAN
jgi:hypothetical protein